MGQTEQYSEAFMLAAEFAAVQGGTPISRHEACFEGQVNDAWWFALNGHHEPKVCGRGVTVDPFTCYVEFNHWPAGHLDAGGGYLLAHASEDAFIEALQSRMEDV